MQVIVVMGASGCGKSTIGRMLAERLGCAFLEGDDFHAPASVAKMARGIALDDADRLPWLERLAAAACEQAERGGRAVISCSALKRSYRDRILSACGGRALFVHLAASGEELARRVGSRPGHFMPASLIVSQQATLEPPAVDEPAQTFRNDGDAVRLVDDVLAWIAGQPTVPTKRMSP